jgi:integrase
MAKKNPKSPMRGLTIMTSRGTDEQGRWYWRYRVTLDGKLITRWAGWATASEAKAAAVAAEASPRELPEEEDPKPQTVRELLRIWLRWISERVTDDREAQLADQVRPRTLVAYRGSAMRLCPSDGERHAGSTDLGELLVERVIEDHLRTYRDRSGFAPKTVHDDLKVLGAAWDWARDRGLVTTSFPKVATTARTTRPKPVPTAGEVAEAIAQLDGWHRLAVLLLAATGARIGELGLLTLDRVRLEEDGVQVCLWEKGRAGRWVYLSASTASELRSWLAVRPDHPFLLGRSPAATRAAVSKALNRLHAGGVLAEHLSPHALRRMASTTLLERGVDPLAYEAQMGHSYTMGLAAYGAAHEEQRRKTGDLLALPRGEVVPFRRPG